MLGAVELIQCWSDIGSEYRQPLGAVRKALWSLDANLVQ